MTTSILSDPSFDPEKFIKYHIIGMNHRKVLNELIQALPPLLLAEVEGKLAINELWRGHSRNIIESLKGEQVTDQLIQKFAAIMPKLESGPAMAVAAMVEQPTVEKWLMDDVLDNAHLALVATGLANGSVELTENIALSVFCKLLENNESDFQWNHDNAMRHLLSRIPQDNKIVNDIAFGKKKISGRYGSSIRNRTISRLDPESRIRLLAELYQSQDPQKDTLIRTIRHSTILPSEGVKCPYCVKKLKSFPGITLHLKAIHAITK